jgi:peptidoglycan-associated lipoprotein
MADDAATDKTGANETGAETIAHTMQLSTEDLTMMNKNAHGSTPRTLLALAALAALVACSSPVKLNNTAPVETRTGTTPGQASTTTPAAATAGTGSSAGTGGVKPIDLTKGDAMATAPAGRIVYFDFDSFVVKDEFRPVVEGNARQLAADRKLRMSIEGHTDERGGREYNLALGQKRSEAVLKSLTLLGANDAQLEAVSFGKERPAMQGSDEAAWAKNRRAEIVAR